MHLVEYAVGYSFTYIQMYIQTRKLWYAYVKLEEYYWTIDVLPHCHNIGVRIKQASYSLYVVQLYNTDLELC